MPASEFHLAYVREVARKSNVRRYVEYYGISKKQAGLLAALDWQGQESVVGKHKAFLEEKGLRPGSKASRTELNRLIEEASP